MNGSKATVRIKSEETLERIAQILQAALSTPPFWFDSDQEPPHSITAMTECLGFEIWLRATDAKPNREYVMIVECSMDVRDLVDAHMIDVSEWLSKHVRIVTNLDCEPLPTSIGHGLFLNDKK